jgi:hypothetical protein
LERKRAKDAAYYARNRDRLKEANRLYYAANQEAIRARRTAQRRSCPALPLWRSAKERAAKKGVPFDLSLEDIVVPERCPILEIPLAKGAGRCQPNSPTLDRLNPALGYVRGNVAVISHRANSIKNDASLDELAAVLNWLEQKLAA